MRDHGFHAFLKTRMLAWLRGHAILHGRSHNVSFGMLSLKECFHPSIVCCGRAVGACMGAVAGLCVGSGSPVQTLHSDPVIVAATWLCDRRV